MWITDALLGEHAALRLVLEGVEQVAGGCSTVEELRAGFAPFSVALAAHAGVEDELLFAGAEGREWGVGVIGPMRDEHRAIERLMHEVSMRRDLDEARAAVDELAAVVREHFLREEEVLFPAVIEALSDDELSALGEQWARRRDVRLA